MKSALATAVLFASLAASTVAAAWEPTANVLRALGGGRPWSEVSAADGGAGLIHAVIDIPVPPRTVWSVMNDCRQIPKLIVTVVSCKVLQGDAEHNGWDVRETVTRGNFFIPDIHNVYRSDYQPYSLIRFRKFGGNLRIEDGEWRLESLNNGAGTRVIYVNTVAADIMAPPPLVREAMRRDTAKVLVNLRQVSLSAPR